MKSTTIIGTEYVNYGTIREVDRVKAWCIMIINDKRQEALVDDRLSDMKRNNNI